MKKKISAATFAKKTTMLIRPKIQPCEPSGIPGKCQPPKNSVTITAEPVIIAAYSPRKYKANFIELYSMKFALYFLGEYAAMITGSAVIVTLFFGGWHFPGIPDGSHGWIFGLINIVVFF